ncbi:MAG TPA: methylated-DNA--[protein]-cysteine S-methyltransferase [Bacteroidota bacterium]|nr:methylated-DNA--[protein]-cysteine S-methyltransferase [Bacteroidota bacterium]
MKKIYWTSFSSRIGTIYVASSDHGVCKISIPASGKKEFMQWLQQHTNGMELSEVASKNRQIIEELDRYLDRKLVKFHSPLDLMGTEFQKDVWGQLRKVRYGTTITYKELARRVGIPGAYQTVGRANGANPLPIVVPCHRVIGSDDSLVGYGAGIKTKEFLLRLEGALLI